MKIIETPKAKFTNVKDLVQMCPILLSTRTHMVIYYFQMPMTKKRHTYIYPETFPAMNLLSLSPPGCTDN